MTNANSYNRDFYARATEQAVLLRCSIRCCLARSMLSWCLMTEQANSYPIDPALLPDYSAWCTVNPGLTLAQYARSLVQLDHLFAIASLLWPEVIQHEGGLFLADGFTLSSFETWSREMAGNLTAIERTMNHRHMGDFLRSLDDAPLPILVSAGTLLRDCWKGRLEQFYLQMPTQVAVFHSDHDVEVTFSVVRP